MDKRWPDRLWALYLVTAAGILVALAFPHLMSAYHLEAGGRAIGNPPLALEHLQKAVKWAPNNAQAYRLLGGVHRAQDDWPAALNALMRYAELRPNNPLGSIELAETYEMLEAKIAGMQFSDLVALLPQEEVTAPYAPELQADGSHRPSAVVQTSLSLPPNFGARPTLLMHAPSWVTYSLLLRSEPAILRFGMGIDRQVQGWTGTGVAFTVLINGKPVFLEPLDKTMARRGWQERVVDLAPWAGQTVALTLGITSGPMGDMAGGWVGWGSPQIVDAQLPALEALDPRVRMVEAWRRAGLTFGDFIGWGEEARTAGLYGQARTWFERAMQLEPQVGDPWYYLGLLHESQGQWPQSLEAYGQALASDHFLQVGRSSVLYRMATIYQLRLPTPQAETAMATYNAALAEGDFNSAADAAWTRARLGQLHYDLQKDATAAEAEILKALTLVPDDPWLYIVLGEVYNRQGRLIEARDMYEQALEIEPSFEGAQTRLDALEKRE